jgi:hypothetical protein
MVTLCARLAWRKGTFAEENQTRDKAGRKASRQPVRLRRWKNPVDRTGIKYPGSRGPRDLKKESTTTNGIGAWTSGQQLLLGSGRMHMKALDQMVGVKIVKPDDGSFARIRKIKEWTLWRGRPPPKRLKS